MATPCITNHYKVQICAFKKMEKGINEIYCSSCGNIVKMLVEICPHCGVRVSFFGKVPDEAEAAAARNRASEAAAIATGEWEMKQALS